MHISSVIAFSLVVFTTACAGGQTVKDAPAPAPPLAVAPAPAAAAPPPATASQAPPVPVPAKAKTKPTHKPIEKLTWSLKQGKLPRQPTVRLVAKTKDKNGHDFIQKCWNYGDHAIFQSQVEGEVGAAEAFVRYGSKALCGAEFSGRTADLDISEGFFAGIAGGFILSDGAEIADGMREFQIFSLDAGKLAFKSAHHPTADFTLSQNGDVVSLDFFTKIKVDCELADEGEACWKKVLEANGIKRSTPMPDCKASFKRAKKDLTEPALVTVPARVPNLASPKMEILGGQATCDPEI